MPETKAAPDAAEKKGSLPADTGKNPNATPNASTSGSNSPKK